MFYLMRRKELDRLLLTVNSLQKTVAELTQILRGLEAIVQLAEENRRRLIIKDNQGDAGISHTPSSLR